MAYDDSVKRTHFDVRWLLYANGSLLIKGLQASDEGMYTCISTVGGAYDTARAYVHVVPGEWHGVLGLCWLLLASALPCLVLDQDE